MMYYTGNRWLNEEEMKVNAAYLWNYFQTKGWTLEAVSGMLGNMQTESHINPGIWQGLDEGNLTGGYGIVQWTPASKFIDWCNSFIPPKSIGTMESNFERILYEVSEHIQWYATEAFPLSFEEFTQSTESPDYLAMAFLANYERPADPVQPQRGTQALEWYEFLGGLPKKKKKKSKPYLYVRKRRYILL